MLILKNSLTRKLDSFHHQGLYLGQNVQGPWIEKSLDYSSITLRPTNSFIPCIQEGSNKTERVLSEAAGNGGH